MFSPFLCKIYSNKHFLKRVSSSTQMAVFIFVKVALDMPPPSDFNAALYIITKLETFKESLSFPNFWKKGGVHIFPTKRRGWENRGRGGGGLFQKRRGITFQCCLSLSVCCMYVCFVYLHHFYQYLCFTGRTWYYSI